MLSSYKNILWVELIDSWKNWPNVGIFAVNHWNEKVWLDVFEYLKKDNFLKKRLKTWKVFLIAVNLLARGKNVRFVDDNMNRIWNKPFKGWSYEFIRMQELKPVLDELDIAIDLHSVSKWNVVYWIWDKKFIKDIKAFMDVPVVLLDNMSKTWALIWYLIRRWKIAFGLECGNHNQNDAYKIGLQNVLNLLVYYGLVDWNINLKNKDKKFFEFLEEIYPQSENFKFVKDFEGFLFVKKWQVYAIDEDKKYIAPQDCYVGLPCKKPNPKDWCGFLFRRVELDIK